MTGDLPLVSISSLDYDAVLFDLDGVLTQTARVHAAAWKRLFVEFLARRAERVGEPFVPFDEIDDYLRYVDGRPRHEGVAAFLESRGISLPPGTPDDGEDVESWHGLGRCKDRYFLEQLAHGVDVFPSSIDFVRALRDNDVKTAVVSSSRNCKAVLEAAGIDELFDVRVDGLDLDAHGLAGKPAPDTFLAAAKRLHVEPARAVVIEDAIAGVAAGRAGAFGLVIGVDRAGRSQALREAGADAVVADLAQLQVATEPPSAWSLVYTQYDPAHEGTREALCALGNGRSEEHTSELQSREN